jgi:hypothetical protein
MPRPRAGLFVFDWPDFTRYSRYDNAMKPLPAPPIPGNTEAERFDSAVRKTFTVSKQEMQRREAEWQRQNGKRPANGK